MFLKNKNIIFKIRRSKVTDYAALNATGLNKIGICGILVITSPQYQPSKMISPRAKSFVLVLAYNKSQVNPSF